MSIASEIQRLTTAKAAIRSAIQAKGVTVPASAKLDGYDDYIAAIQTGGGGSVSLQSKSVSPSSSQQVVQPDTGYGGLSQVTVGAAPLQNKSVTANGTVSPDSGYYGLGAVEVNVPEGVTLVPAAGNYPVLISAGAVRGNSASLTSTGLFIRIPVTGTYRFKWVAFRTNASGTFGTQLYRERSGESGFIGTENTSWTNSYYQSNSVDVECQAGDVIVLYARSRGTSYYIYVSTLSACVSQWPWQQQPIESGDYY